MAELTITTLEELQATVGTTVGPSAWREISQEMVDTFAQLSGDHQWIHVDRERARTESPYGTTIAHGNLTLATIDGFRDELVAFPVARLG
jgi:acyl dehydratase